LPTGEICVYGIDEILQMTQISATEIIQAIPVAGAPKTVFSPEIILAILTALIVGLAFGATLSRKLRLKQ
jgi:hypothetical protein